MKKILIAITFLLLTSSLFGQFATFDPIIHKPRRGYIPPPIILPDLPEYNTNQSTSSNNVSAMTSYRARKKFTWNKEWENWVYSDISIILDEDRKYLEFNNNSGLKIYYDSLGYVEQSTTGNKIFVSNNAIDNKNNKVRLTFFFGQTSTYINLVYSDIEYMYELKQY